MKFLGLLAPLMACTITTTFVAVAAADYNTVLADLAVISSLTDQLDRDIKAVQPSFVGLPSQLQIQSDAVSIHKKVINATADVNASPPYGTAGSNAVYRALVALSTKVNSTLADTVAQRAQFGELTPIVRASLEALKQDTFLFGLAQAAKFDPAVTFQAFPLIFSINSAYDAAITAYGGNPNNA